MKGLLGSSVLFMVIFVLLSCCKTVPMEKSILEESIDSIEEESVQLDGTDFYYDDNGRMIFRDWDIALKYARQDEETAKQLLIFCAYALKKIIYQRDNNLLSEEEAKQLFNEVYGYSQILLSIIKSFDGPPSI